MPGSCHLIRQYGGYRLITCPTFLQLLVPQGDERVDSRGFASREVTRSQPGYYHHRYSAGQAQRIGWRNAKKLAGKDAGDGEACGQAEKHTNGDETRATRQYIG